VRYTIANEMNMYDRDKGESHTSMGRALSAIASLPPEKEKQHETTVIIFYSRCSFCRIII